MRAYPNPVAPGGLPTLTGDFDLGNDGIDVGRARDHSGGNQPGQFPTEPGPELPAEMQPVPSCHFLGHCVPCARRQRPGSHRSPPASADLCSSSARLVAAPKRETEALCREAQNEGVTLPPFDR